MRRLGLVAAAVATLGSLVIVPARAVDAGPPYMVGTARRSIAPAFPYPDGTIYVGGVIPGPLRVADGNAADTFARAVAISTPGGEGVVLVEIDIQGAFAATKQGPYGLDDAARVAGARLGIDPARILIGSSHTHAGADIMGIWGGSPASYARVVHDQTVEAVVAAWHDRRPARLSWAATHAPDMLTNQSRFQGMDDELRVLVARDPSGAIVALLPNWQGHPSVVPGNELHPDWPGILDGILEARHPDAFTMAFVGAVGHTQTNVGGNTDEAVGIQRATQYATDLADRLDAAIAASTPVAPGVVRVASVFLHEQTTSALALAMEHLTPDRTTSLYRSDQPPWLDGLVIGTRATLVRIGDVVLASVPGEAYPWIHFQLRDWVGRETFLLGLAGDTLGYLVAPSEDVPKFATDVNDNEVLLISRTIGDHVLCSLLRGAQALGLRPLDALPARCAALTGDDVHVAG